MRKTIGAELYNLALEDSSIVALTADLAESVGFEKIRSELPNQFVECGIAEQQMMSIAAGFALSGKKPIAGSYAAFHPGRNWDQLRTSVCYNHAPVRILSSHYGLNVGGDGATHQCLEYFALTLSLPNLRVLSPFNTHSAKWSIQEAMNEDYYGTVVFQPRTDHGESIDEFNVESFVEDGFCFASHSQESKSLVISTGLISEEVMKVYASGDTPCDVVFLVDITSFDREKLAKIIYRYNRILIVEEHQDFGGIGSLIFGIMARYKLAKDIRHICIKKKFGKSAINGKELWSKYQIDSETIAQHLL